jgi:hypothetical protein
MSFSFRLLSVLAGYPQADADRPPTRQAVTACG